MTRYIYNGPPSGATLRDGQEVMLHPGQEVDLNPSSLYTQTLIAQGRIQESPDLPADAASARKSAKAEKVAEKGAES